MLQWFKIDVMIDSGGKKPPFFTGSMLRGSFGYALKRVTCINPSFECNGCFAQEKCLYFEHYEKPNTFHRYRFDVNLESNNFDFSLYLFNGSKEELAYVLEALRQMITKQGLTVANHRFEHVMMLVNGTLVFKDGSFHDMVVEPTTLKNGNGFVSNVHIKFQTPLRMKKGNRFAKESVELEDVLRSIYQRYEALVGNKSVYTLPYKPQYSHTVKAFTYKHLTRKSVRQRTKLNIDGLIGEMGVLGIDEQSYNLLKLGEIIGVGKQTVMGLGKIKVEEMDTK